MQKTRQRAALDERDTACCAERQWSQFCDRWANNPARRLRRQPAHRKRIEEAFGWIKTIAGQEKTSFRGRDRVGRAFTFAAAAYNLVRLPKLITQTG